ncbi:MAG TPA: DUF3369 domain-containing protein [Spirochaetota bacterium]|nr:DUF3369 domain-containing protein [Spirochaetota bacterium]HOL55977.1 DUF3369 domain-containing protein [Spirochaetota bacterium]HPP03591.1 DUF3369 domain-containing protein [Spirochaetota bacterium]
MIKDNIPEKDELIFAEEEISSFDKSDKKEYWKILIVDDDKEVHTITKLVLNNLSFKEKYLQFLSAYSAKETKDILKEHPDIAIVLLDVVMEEDDAGLKLISYIREELKNKLIRIVLRTGQPGLAPEEKVIIDYDINDYKSKTELTTQKLYTTIISALRTYNDMVTIDNNKKGLQKIIEASANIFEIQSMQKFANAILSQLTSLLSINKNALYCQASGFTITKEKSNDFLILAATGEYDKFIEKKVSDVMPENIIKDIELTRKNGKSMYFDNHYIGYFLSRNDSENMVYIEGWDRLNDWEKNLIEIFCTNVSIAYDNLYLNQEIEDTQKEIIFKLGEIVETRSNETGLHVKRVAEYSYQLALLCGLLDEDARIIKLASPMHDIGKLGIPDSILNKPSELTDEELTIIKKHSLIGYEMLKNSNRRIIKTAAIIALQHHERYDGKGYPQGLKGDEISIYGKITAIADVFDALSTDKVYKKAYNKEDIINFFINEKGKYFDPDLTEKFLNNFDFFWNIKNNLT